VEKSQYGDLRSNDRKSLRPYPIWSILFKTFGYTLAAAGTFYFVHLFAVFASPLLLKQLMEYLSDPHDDSFSKGIVIVLLFCLAPMTKSITYHQYYQRIQRVALQIEGSIQTSIFHKFFTLNSISRSKFDIGQVVNFITIDAPRIAMISPWFHFSWNGPLTILFAIILLWNLVGVSAFGGIFVILMLSPITLWLSNTLGKSETRLSDIRDERLRELSELFNNIKVIKLYTLEAKFQQKILELRNLEYQELKSNGTLDLLQNVLSKLVPVLGGIITFTIYILMGNQVTSTIVFVSISIFAILEVPLVLSTHFAYEVMNAYISANRVKEFLSMPSDFAFSETSEKVGELSDDFLFPTVKAYIDIQNASYQWEDKLALTDINLTVDNPEFMGKLICVIGPNASGKTSLFDAISGNVTKVSGNQTVVGKIAYCSATPWMINGTIRQNILFGQPYQQGRYEKIIKICQLEKDLRQLEKGDFTLIESSINLSGGQKSRISLARACYSDADIYLFDSTLASLDVEVAKKIFDRCINGFLAGKIRFLVTHSLQFITKADYILSMKNGTIDHFETFSRMRQVDTHFDQMVSKSVITSDEKEEPSTPSGAITEPVVVKEVTPPEMYKTVDFTVYYNYFSGYGFYFAMICVVSILARISELGSGIWLSMWSENPYHSTVQQSMVVYIFLGFSVILLSFLQQIFFLFGGLKSAMKLHDDMLSCLLRSPISWFDHNPIGAILTRFSEDVMRVDESVYVLFATFTQFMLASVSVLVFILWVAPIMIFFIAPICVIYYYLQHYFRRAFIKLRRLVEKLRAPVSSLISTSISGSHTIRAYQKEGQFIREMENRVDLYQCGKWIEIVMYRWLSLRLELLSLSIVFFVSMFGIIFKGTLHTVFIGLAVAYSLQISENFNWTIRTFIQCESGLINVERIHQFTELPQELPDIMPKNRPPKEWPTSGEIKFENVSMRYKTDSNLVLKDISLTIKPGQTVGIVGRSGSGKTSLMLALFRMVELFSGRILIDSIDIAKIGLLDLRSKISIIPQEPTIFSGSLRSNIDPFGEHHDFEIWNALESVHLRETVEKFVSKLDEEMTLCTFSSAQKQLLCLCRALLKRNRVVVLDESTANLDLKSENLIQKTILETFKNQTVIAIAHRLDTVIDADIILVLENGVIEENASPATLMKNSDSLFYAMVKKTGPENLEKLKTMALLSEENKNRKRMTTNDALLDRVVKLEKEIIELKKK
jgi:ATP-binding cassette subfamily C (CFTR/MRP) protein 1